MKKFYVTTAIDYPNAEPHVGHTYQKVIADILARWHRMKKEKVFLLTGLDEHGKKIQEAAEKVGKTPKEFVDEQADKFKLAWKVLNISYDRFIRTTDKDHEKLVQEVIKKCEKNGDIYKGFYKGLYCVGCEAYITEKEVVDGCCPIHKRPVEKLNEESYFFRLSKYQKFLLDLYKTDFVLPRERRNEIIARVKEELKDLSISRTSFNWGIPYPGDKKHVVYVWMDALFNYISGGKKFWPADIQLLGKDNGWFHAVYWPAFLKSAGLKLPKTVFIHGFLTFNGEKISKSLGNAISPITLVEKYGADTIRYFLARQFPFAQGEDGDFNEEKLVDRNNNELANKLGNLVSRVSALAEKYGLQKTKNKLIKKLKEKEINKLMESYQLDKALNLIFEFIDACNFFVQENKIWETGDKKQLYELIDSLKKIANLLEPFMPESSDKIKVVFSGKKIIKAEVLFKKIEIKEDAVNKTPKENLIKSKIIDKAENITTMADLVKFEDFSKLDLRVARIIKAEDIEGADKLYKLELDVGELGKRVICAGIKQHYSKEELKNKKIIIIANLEPRVMKGIKSEGMLLAAGNKETNKCVLLTPDKDIDIGSRIS